MDEKERREMDASREKNRTANEDKRYEELLRKFFEEMLYTGDNEEE